MVIGGVRRTSLDIVRLLLAVHVLVVTGAAGTYIPWGGGSASQFGSAAAASKANNVDSIESRDASRRHRAFFRDDAEIYRYLKSHGRQLMLWRCRNAIQTQWKHRPVPFIDLYCDVIGNVQSSTWIHKGHEIVATPGVVKHQHRSAGELSTDGAPAAPVSRYHYTINAHRDTDGRYYTAWLDFNLRIYNATQRDSGLYRFQVSGPGGDRDEQIVYVDISSAAESPSTTTTKKTDKQRRKELKLRRRQQQQQQPVDAPELWTGMSSLPGPAVDNVG